jgi:hypothetical protein
VRLDGGTREHFLGVLSREFPHLSEGYARLFSGGSRVPQDYAASVQQQVSVAIASATQGQT